eukprot:gene5403-3890_t
MEKCGTILADRKSRYRQTEKLRLSFRIYFLRMCFLSFYED